MVHRCRCYQLEITPRQPSWIARSTLS